MRVGWVQIDCEDPDRLRTFWGALLGLDDDDSPTPPQFRCLAPRDPLGIGICFQRVPESKTVKNRVHLDVIAADLEAAATLVEELGGSRRGDRPDFSEHGWRWRTMTDPEGNEFCLVPEST